MKNLLACLAAALLYASCVNDPVSYDTSTYALDMGPGDNRVMLRQFTVEDGDSTLHVYGLQEIAFEKDTVFNGYAGRIFAYTFNEIYLDTTYTYQNRRLIVQEGDSLYEYVFDQGSGGNLVGLLKAALDTAAFNDRILHAVFPLRTGEPWLFRPEDTDPDALTKEYLGRETLSFEGKKYECAVFVLHGVADVPLKTWVSRLGVLKAEIVFGETLSSWSGQMVKARETYRMLRVNASPSEIVALKAEYRAKSTIPAILERE